MAQYDTNVNIRVNSEIKKQAQELFADMGLDMTTAINLFLRQAIRKNGLPFEIRRDEPNAKTYEAMAAAEAGEDLYGPFDSVADLMEALNA